MKRPGALITPPFASFVLAPQPGRHGRSTRRCETLNACEHQTGLPRDVVSRARTGLPRDVTCRARTGLPRDVTCRARTGLPREVASRARTGLPRDGTPGFRAEQFSSPGRSSRRMSDVVDRGTCVWSHACPALAAVGGGTPTDFHDGWTVTALKKKVLILRLICGIGPRLAAIPGNNTLPWTYLEVVLQSKSTLRLI
jgi:hypothetical protein